MYVIEVCLGEFGSVYAPERVEGPYAPVGCELFEVDFGFLFGCDATDFVLDGSSPVEYGSAYVQVRALMLERSVISCRRLSELEMMERSIDAGDFWKHVLVYGHVEKVCRSSGRFIC